MQNIFCLQESRNIADFCKNLPIYRSFARTLEEIYCVQELCKITFLRNNIATYLNFVKLLQEIYFLQESRKISNLCKNFARYLIFAKTLQETVFLEEFSKKSIVYKIHARYPKLARVSFDIVFLLEHCRIITLQEVCKVFDICKESADYLQFTRTLQGIYISQGSWEVSIFARISQHLSYLWKSSKILFDRKKFGGFLLFAKTLQDL